MIESSTSQVGTGSPVRIETRRLIVRLADEEEASAVLRFYVENREHLRPFDPERPDHFYEERFWQGQLQQNAEHAALDLALRLFLFPKGEPGRVIGNVSFSNFVRGIAHYCTVGYSIAEAYQGQGLMSEALKASIDFAFERLHLHRIEANYMPHNRRSAMLLRGLGFVVEGYSRDYLRINGHWEDHVRSALLNPDWKP
jgi:[ribosomal protein S5]-alanine N-acetyltransferase